MGKKRSWGSCPLQRFGKKRILGRKLAPSEPWESGLFRGLRKNVVGEVGPFRGLGKNGGGGSWSLQRGGKKRILGSKLAPSEPWKYGRFRALRENVAGEVGPFEALTSNTR